MPETDIAVIGAGAAGRGLASLAVALGLRVTLFERGPMGGEAPDPELIQAALRAAGARAALARSAARMGIGSGDVPVDWLALRTHLAAADADAAPDSTAARFEAMGVELVRATGRFSAPDAVAAAGQEWRFRRALVATGAAPVIPSLEGLETVPYLTEETIHALEERPDHLLILGGGGFGLEMAQAFARLGTRATVIEATRIAPGADPVLAEGLARALRRDGVVLMEGREPARAERREGGVSLLLADGTRVEGSHLLLALGRAPRLAGLDLVTAGLPGPGLVVDESLRVEGSRRIWAAGGVIGHAGASDLGALARSMLFRVPGMPATPAPLRAIRTEPALVELGAPDQVEAAETLRWPLADTTRASAEGIEEGLVTLSVDRRGRLVGAGLLAPGGLEMAGMLSLALGRPVAELAAASLPQPTLSAAIARAALEHRAPSLTNPGIRWLAGIAKRLP
ncbi:Pyruvate/2-oxoglutarate dehydrogenase complex, dihydrolipoamide dehydrogenase (E3) component [Roseomonas rosea]|uniref:Pyruvate/2-oxoglutarate dehydrogenase complex, dihydrolipoamide dehydrogenase (E3) component n=1 Tax=Muricoccus roseus TaxID=198092 RepID=A0A1M6L131_9PROT|nr:FAD-dependent oxidoreductase [Roseomonas rosea]SHJ64975.1 Pyruvate/2-oxoglutarate dehydrogenase complex, dihydrolipoamide dehydrogenase (E3) component [Roseomonas rosea]